MTDTCKGCGRLPLQDFSRPHYEVRVSSCVVAPEGDRSRHGTECMWTSVDHHAENGRFWGAASWHLHAAAAGNC